MPAVEDWSLPEISTEKFPWLPCGCTISLWQLCSPQICDIPRMTWTSPHLVLTEAELDQPVPGAGLLHGPDQGRRLEARLPPQPHHPRPHPGGQGRCPGEQEQEQHHGARGAREWSTWPQLSGRGSTGGARVATAGASQSPLDRHLVTTRTMAD